MRYYSDILKDFFDTEAECNEAEHRAKVAEQERSEKAAEKRAKEEAHKAKIAALRQNVTEATEKVTAAKKALIETQDKVKEFAADYLAKVEEYVGPFQKDYDNAVEEKAEALKALYKAQGYKNYEYWETFDTTFPTLYSIFRDILEK